MLDHCLGSGIGGLLCISSEYVNWVQFSTTPLKLYEKDVHVWICFFNFFPMGESLDIRFLNWFTTIKKKKSQMRIVCSLLNPQHFAQCLAKSRSLNICWINEYSQVVSTCQVGFLEYSSLSKENIVYFAWFLAVPTKCSHQQYLYLKVS